MRKDPRKQNHQRHRGYCARGGFVGHTIWSRTVGPVPDTAGAQCRPHTQLPAHMPAAATHDTECVRVARGRIAATPCAQLRTPAMDASPRRLRHLPLVSTGMQLLALPVRYLVLRASLFHSCACCVREHHPPRRFIRSRVQGARSVVSRIMPIRSTPWVGRP